MDHSVPIYLVLRRIPPGRGERLAAVAAAHADRVAARSAAGPAAAAAGGDQAAPELIT